MIFGTKYSRIDEEICGGKLLKNLKWYGMLKGEKNDKVRIQDFIARRFVSYLEEC